MSADWQQGRPRCPHVRSILAALLLALLAASVADAARTRCPVSTEVYPYPQLSYASYEVQITDGGPGDTDHAIDGVCLFRTRFCLASPAAAPESCEPIDLDSLVVEARWRLDAAVRDATTENLMEGLSQLLGGPEFPGNALAFEPPTRVSDECVEVPIRVPAETVRSARRKLRLKFTTIATDEEGRFTQERSRLRLKCHPRRRFARTAIRTACRAGRSTCVEGFELPPGVPGDEPGPPPPPPEPPPPPPPPTDPPTDPPPPPPPPPPPGTGRVFYLSPSGNDGSDGTTPSTAWRTFGRVFNSSKVLEPGDTLVLRDGTYSRTTTGLPKINCGASGNARSGQLGLPITIRAENERRALLSSDGLAPGFEMIDCSWWIVQGLRARSTDNPSGRQSEGYPFRFAQVSNVSGIRLLGSHNNRAHNTHVFAVELSTNVLLEECEAYYFHRHGYSIFRSRFVTIRRCYANSMRYGAYQCCSEIDNRSWGDEAFSLYGTSDSVIENSISENQAGGFQVHGISSPLDPSGHGGRRNRVLGSISLDDAVPGLVSSRANGPTSYHNARDNVFRDFVAARMGGHGLFFRDAAANLAENVTLYGSTSNSGLVADQSSSTLGGTCSGSLVCPATGASCRSSSDCSSGPCTRNPDGCSFTARNVLSFGNAGFGFLATDQQSWRIEGSNAAGNGTNYSPSETIDDGAGNIRSSLSTTPSLMGLGLGQCLAWVPSASTMVSAGIGGAPIGARIVNRYRNGVLTTEPLWDRTTGAFPCGAVVSGINDGATRCTNFHARLNVQTNGCLLP